jgi:EmrB/QacA subfamily drug resistance transporter
MEQIKVRKQTTSTQWALMSLALSMLLSSLGISIANVALPTLAQVFITSYQGVQWVVLAYLLAITVLIVSVGRLGDIIGHRRVLLGGIFTFTVASLLCGLATTLWLLFVARAVQGLGAAILMAMTVALVREMVPKEKTGSAMGLLGTMSAIGTALGPSLGGVLISGLGWRAIFLIMVPMGVLNFLLTHHFLPVLKERAQVGLSNTDILGTLLLGVALASYALAMTVGAGRFDRLNMGLMLAAVITAGLFVFVEGRVRSPLIRLAAFRNVVLSSSLAMNALVATVMMATLVVGPFFLSRTLGLSPALVGLTMSVGPIISTLSGIPSGRLVDRMGARIIVISGLVAMAVGSFALAILPLMFGIAGYIAAIAVLTPGYQLFQAANNTVTMADVPSDQLGIISGMLSLSRNLGLITGASVMGAVFAFASGTSDIATAAPESVTHGMQITFVVAGILIAVALAIAMGSLFASTPTGSE